MPLPLSMDREDREKDATTVGTEAWLKPLRRAMKGVCWKAGLSNVMCSSPEMNSTHSTQQNAMVTFSPRVECQMSLAPPARMTLTVMTTQTSEKIFWPCLYNPPPPVSALKKATIVPTNVCTTQLTKEIGCSTG